MTHGITILDDIFGAQHPWDYFAAKARRFRKWIEQLLGAGGGHGSIAMPRAIALPLPNVQASYFVYAR
jgi:hypothetical protein